MLAALRAYLVNIGVARYNSPMFSEVVKYWPTAGTIDAQFVDESQSAATDAIMAALTDRDLAYCVTLTLRGRVVTPIDMASIGALAKLLNQDQRTRVKNALLLWAAQPNSAWNDKPQFSMNPNNFYCFQDDARTAAQQL
jgi:hypothetical protein